jgi:hypothetical protein
VLAFDHRSGTWSERRVAVFHESIYEGPLLTITTEAGSVRCTIYHPFWVIAGRDLSERSTPRELAENEDQGLSLDGRWVNSHELRCGDRLIGHDGKLRTVLKIEQDYVSAFLVHNLTIDDQHTFAVGPDAVLVHNTVDCSGDIHHPISKRVHAALEENENLRGLYSARDPRFTTQAVDKAAHNGYFGWHEQLDDEIAAWIRQNPSLTPETFEAGLRQRYGQPDLIRRFPNGF